MKNTKRIVESFEEYSGFTGIQPRKERGLGIVGVEEPIVFTNLQELKDVLGSGKIVRVDYSFSEKVANFENNMNFTYYMQQKSESPRHGNVYLGIPQEGEDYTNTTYFRRTYSEMRTSTNNDRSLFLSDSPKYTLNKFAEDVLKTVKGKELPSSVLGGKVQRNIVSKHIL